MLIAPAEDSAPTTASGVPPCAEATIEVEFAGKARVRIPGSIPAALAVAVVKALSRR